jgi:NAD(P)-dependent dehydrogenase (short-subunit alcohol dehydrogenase family)
MTRTATITGAASGIGQAACRRLPEAGWTVFGLDNACARLDRVSHGFDAFQGRSRPVLRDAADAARVAAAFIPPGSNP